MFTFAAEVAVDAGGLVLGLVLGLLIYLVGTLVARQTGEGLIATIALVVGVIVFFVLGFDITGEVD